MHVFMSSMFEIMPITRRAIAVMRVTVTMASVAQTERIKLVLQCGPEQQCVASNMCNTSSEVGK